MSELTLMLVRFGYLAIMWIFVLSAVSVIRSDMFGARIDTKQLPKPERQPAPKRAPKQRGRRGAPRLLSVIEGNDAGLSVELTGTSVLIGRSADADLHVNDDYASNRHARIAASGDQWFVEDLGSTNGTYIGSQRLTTPTAVNVGTRIRIGKTVIEIKK